VEVWNAVVPVVALVEAGSEAEAANKLTDALDKAGFESYDGPVDGIGAFKSEPGTEANLL
jgi:hypothetical protein